jgi:Polyketide cyclase / dehydrase and lipid transport
MRYVRLFLLSFGSLFLLITVISLFIPSRVRISRAANIKAPFSLVWKQVDDMQQWRAWNPFFAELSASEISHADTSNGSLQKMEVNGTSISWKEKKQNERIAEMLRPGSLPVINGWKCISHPGSDSTTIHWYMDFHLRWYPWEKFGSIMLERSYGPKMEQGLTQLKEVIQNDRTSN